MRITYKLRWFQLLIFFLIWAGPIFPGENNGAVKDSIKSTSRSLWPEPSRSETITGNGIASVQERHGPFLMDEQTTLSIHGQDTTIILTTTKSRSGKQISDHLDRITDHLDSISNVLWLSFFLSVASAVVSIIIVAKK